MYIISQQKKVQEWWHKKAKVEGKDIVGHALVKWAGLPSKSSSQVPRGAQDVAIVYKRKSECVHICSDDRWPWKNTSVHQDGTVTSAVHFALHWDAGPVPTTPGSLKNDFDKVLRLLIDYYISFFLTFLVVRREV